MKAIQLHDKYSEEIIGTVLVKDHIDFGVICDAWDKYQENHNSNRDEQPNIYDFVDHFSYLCEVLEIDFYQP